MNLVQCINNSYVCQFLWNGTWQNGHVATVDDQYKRLCNNASTLVSVFYESYLGNSHVATVDDQNKRLCANAATVTDRVVISHFICKYKYLYRLLFDFVTCHLVGFV